MRLAALAARLEDHDGRLALSGAEGWMQGRTMYGGASTWLAYRAVLSRFPDLPPLRAAQVGFVAPVLDSLEIEVTMLRQGRSVSQVSTDLYSDGALAHRTLWLFGSARPANAEIPVGQATGFVPLDEAEPFPGHPDPAFFTHRFEQRRAELSGGTRSGTFRRWIRLRDRDGIDPAGELLAIADALPPGSARAMMRKGPVSSINWSMTLLGEAGPTRDGWWLVETASNFAGDGFSSETLRLWNADGVEVMRGLQSVAIFG
jgi:acyl-CoA thioesterase